MSSVVRARTLTLRWVGVGLVAGLVLAWAFGVGRSPAAQAQAAAGPSHLAGAADTIAFTTTAQDSGQLLYVLDTRAQAFAVYKVDPRDPKGAVKLEASRQYRWDLKLAEYNNQAPEVAAIEAMVSGSATVRK